MTPFFKILVPSVAVLALAVIGRAQVVYTNPGNATTGFASSNLTLGTRTNAGEAWIGTFGTNYGFGAGTTTLTLDGLAAHSAVTISFDLYINGSMDGNDTPSGSPDPWSLVQSGTTTSTLISTNFANPLANHTQAFGGSNGSGGYLTSGTFLPRTGASATNHLGFGTGDYGDTTYSLSFTFASTSSTQAFSFVSGQNQGSDDEGWGLDNITVRITPVPEPAAFATLALGVLPFLRRRKLSPSSSRR